MFGAGCCCEGRQHDPFKAAEEVIGMEGDDDFYVAFENYLDDDEISPEEEGFMRGFTEELLEGE